jgi:predicted NBD/HSP70 family sugar kinase
MARTKLKTKHKIVAKLDAELLRRVRAMQGLSRRDLARQLQLAPSTAGIYVDRLIAEGFLREQKEVERDLGRPPTVLSLNPEGGCFIGVDFEAHNVMATSVDFSQQPLKRVHKPIHSSDSVKKIISKIEQAIEQVLGKNRQPLLGIGIGVPGPVDPSNQIALHYKHIPGWDNIPLAERLRERFKVNVFLENNIRSMALAELWFGHHGLKNFICFGIRTGIGAGIIAEGHLLRGDQNLAGEIRGWLCPVAPFEFLSSLKGAQKTWRCEVLRPLEEIASVPAIIKAVSTAARTSGTSFFKNRAVIGFPEIVEAARAGDATVCCVLESVAQSLAWILCHANTMFSPEKIILAGPLTQLGDLFLEPLTKTAQRFCAEFDHRVPVIVNSELGSFNGALGAAALALHEWTPVR